MRFAIMCFHRYCFIEGSDGNNLPRAIVAVEVFGSGDGYFHFPVYPTKLRFGNCVFFVLLNVTGDSMARTSLEMETMERFSDVFLDQNGINLIRETSSNQYIIH